MFVCWLAGILVPYIPILCWTFGIFSSLKCADLVIFIIYNMPLKCVC